MRINDVEIAWLGHAGFLLTTDGTHVYIDPYQIGRGRPDADYILITHSHYDHLSVQDIDTIVTDRTVLIAPEDARGKLADLPGELRTVSAGDELTLDNLAIRAVPAYNVAKKFHPQDQGWVGYVIELNGTRIYHAGDTDLIEEMDGIDVDVALLPVSGTYVMTAQEAAEATKRITAKRAVPMHWGTFIGDESDAQEFKKLAACDVTILERA